MDGATPHDINGSGEPLTGAAASAAIDDLLAGLASLGAHGERAGVAGDGGVDVAAGVPVGSVHVHCTDVEGEWTVRRVDGGYTVTREHAKGDVALRGPAEALLAVLLGQADLSTIDLFGDPTAARRFLTAAPLGL